MSLLIKLSHTTENSVCRRRTFRSVWTPAVLQNTLIFPHFVHLAESWASGSSCICEQRRQHAVWTGLTESLHWRKVYTAGEKVFLLLFFETWSANIFLFLNEYIWCGYSLEAPHWGASNEYPQYMFSWKNKKNKKLCGYPLLFGAMIENALIRLHWSDL